MESFLNWATEKNITDTLIGYGVNIGLSLILLIFGFWLARRLQNAFERLLRKREVDDVLVDFLGNVVRWVVIVLAVVAALDKVGVPPTSLLAAVGAAGLAIGLAMKDSLSNFAAGVMMALFRPFTKGDFVEAAGTAGTVDEIQLVSTRMTTPDNKVITVPNGLIWNDTIINFSAKDTRRIDMTFGVGYDDDLKAAAEILTAVCAEHPKVLEDPAPVIMVTNLGDSSVDFWVRPWVAAADYWKVRAEIMETAKQRLEAAGLSIPYPQTDVHLHKVAQGD
ncbi:MAG: mechanosensitive ion channel [Gammaproteobacteria bacterium]